MTLFSMTLFYIACSSESNQPADAMTSGSQAEAQTSEAVGSTQTGNSNLPPLGNQQDDGSTPPPLGDQATGVRLDLSVMKPQMSSDDISDPVTISGTISGDCSGDIRIDANENEIDIPEGEPLPGPLVAVTLSEIGAFSFNVPKGKSLSIVAFCDQDGDMRIGQDVDLWTEEPKNLGRVDADQSDLEIKLVPLSESSNQKLPPIDKSSLPSIDPKPAE